MLVKFEKRGSNIAHNSKQWPILINYPLNQLVELDVKPLNI